MESIRQQKVANIIKKDISKIINKMLQNTGVILTISKVRVTQDLQLAKIYFSIFPSNKAPHLLGELKSLKTNIRHTLSQKIRNQMRVVPELLFYVDDSLDYIEEIEEAINNPVNPLK